MVARRAGDVAGVAVAGVAWFLRGRPRFLGVAAGGIVDSLGGPSMARTSCRDGSGVVACCDGVGVVAYCDGVGAICSSFRSPDSIPCSRSYSSNATVSATT